MTSLTSIAGDDDDDDNNARTPGVTYTPSNFYFSPSDFTYSGNIFGTSFKFTTNDRFDSSDFPSESSASTIAAGGAALVALIAALL